MELFEKYRNEFGVFRSNPGIAYFDYAATAFMPRRVLDSYVCYVNETGVSVDRGSTYLHKKAKMAFENAVENITGFFTGSRGYKLIFGKNTTEVINIMVYSVENYIKPLDYVVVGPYEHHSNLLPWKYMARRKDAIFVELPITAGGDIDYDYFEKIAPQIKAISFSAVANTNGYKPDIGRLLDKVPEGAFVMIDAAQAAAHGKIALHDKMSCVFLSSHKMYGPKNISGALVNEDFLELLDPVLLGGGMVETTGLVETWANGEYKFLAGTVDAASVIAWSAACEFVRDIGFGEISGKEKYLYDQIRGKLLALEGIRVIEQPGQSAFSLVSFDVSDCHAHDVQGLFSNNGIFIRSGHLCSQNSIRRYGLDAVNRISFGIGVTGMCLEKLTGALDGLRGVARPKQLPKRRVLIPDEVLVKDGIACGDAVNLIGEVNDGIFEFNITVKGCSQAVMAANVLDCRYNGHNIKTILADCEVYYKALAESGKMMANEFGGGAGDARPECVLSVMRVFLDFARSLNELKIGVCDIEDTSKSLACDACVSISRINWGGHETNEAPQPYGVFETPLSEIRQGEWMRCGKLYLSDEDAALLETLCSRMGDDDFAFIQRYKLDQIIFSHLKKQPGFNPDPRWKKTAAASHRKAIVKAEVDLIKQFISEGNIKASFVKGAVNQDLYTGGADRVFLDYDILAPSADDAFRIGHFLFSRGFTILPGVFSLKKINANGKTGYTGHFHVKKFIDDQYQLIVDISFQGYPLGRIGLFYPKFSGGALSAEEQFIITLCHLFKHKEMFMKDINDLYLMIQKLNMDYRKLNALLSEFGLKFFASVAFSFIFDGYDISEEKKNSIYQCVDLEKNLIEKFNGWPFDKDQVYRVKDTDYRSRLLTSADNQRIYLFPLVVFNDAYKIGAGCIADLTGNGFAFSTLCDGIYTIEAGNARFVLTVMGLFIDNSMDIYAVGRKNIRQFAENILSICGITDFRDVPYLTNDWYF